MKALNLNLTLIFAAIFALISTSEPSAKTADSLIYENDSVFTIESYKDELSNDGEWIKVEKDQVDPDGVISTEADYDGDINYDYIWRPYGVSTDWSPFTNGYWVYTNCGWMWKSYYTWGWRTSHYGRWWWSPVWGWVWSPGFIWAPAWVVWMFYGDYWGWYPISPRIRWHRHHGWHCHNMRFHVRHWTFCHTSNYTSPIHITVIVDPPGSKGKIDKARFVSDINIENGKVVNRGPEVTEIEKATNQKIVSENVTKYNNAKVITEKENVRSEKQFESEKRYNEKQSGNEKQYNSEKQSGNEKEKYNNNDEEKKQSNDEENNRNNEKVNEEKSYEKKNDDNSGEKKQSYESPKKSDDGNNDSKKNDSQKSNDSPKDKSNGSDGGKGNNSNDNVKQKGY